MTAGKRLPRIAGHKLQRIRARWFRMHPLCLTCLDADPPRFALATELDHRVPLFKGGTDTDDNRQGLCSPCHADKTRDDMGHGLSGACDDDGMPIDPRHPWNVQRST